MGMAFPATYRSVAVFSIEDMLLMFFFPKEIDLLVWPQKRCRKAFGSSIADNMMCVSKKKKPIDATCNVGELCSHTF